MVFKEFYPVKDSALAWIYRHLLLIDENNWADVYQFLNNGSMTNHRITEMFYQAGLEPLDYLDYVPEDYLSNNQNLIEIQIPNNIKTLAESAFYGCNRVTEIELPESVTTILDYALAGMDNLKSIYIPGDLEFLSPLAIYTNDSLEKIYSTAKNKEILMKNVTELKHQAKFVEID